MGRKEPNRKQGDETKQSRWGFRRMTVRDWLQLLIVPLALVVIGFLFSVQQDARQQRIENQRAEAERELADQRAQDEALQAYLDQMSQLMLDRKLLEAEQGDPVHTLALARTSTVILRLDAEHNESVTRFLINSGLAVRSKASAALLSEIALFDATLSGAYLSHADLRWADLSGAKYITNEELEHRAISLEGATMSNGQKYEDWPQLLLENVEVTLESRRERRKLADSAAAWLATLREQLSEVEEDTETAYLERRQLVKLLVANISIGRFPGGKPHVQVTYRFGPPQATEVGPEGRYVGRVPNDKAFQVSMPGGISHTFDSFECAIHALAPVCEYCGVKVIGHGVEADGSFYCCAHCANMAGAEGVSDRA